MNKTKRAVLEISEMTGKRIRRVCLEEPFPKSHNIYISTELDGLQWSSRSWSLHQTSRIAPLLRDTLGYVATL